MESLPIYAPIQEDLLQLEDCLKAVINVDFPWLAQILEHILKKRGKRIRPAITILAGNLYPSSNHDLLVPMAAGVELLHTATLVHDDTIDNSQVRRGEATLNSIWNGSTAVLVGDYLFANAAELVSATGNVPVMRLFAQTLMVICNGELRQNHCSFDWQQDRESYYQRIGSKTAALFATAAEAGGMLSEAPQDKVLALRSYGYNLGLAFQIVDDVLDFTGDEAELGKPIGSDLAQGTMTLPAILLVEKYPDTNPIKEAFSHNDAEALKKAIEMIRNSSIIQESYEIAADFCDKARTALRELPARPCRSSLMDLVDYVIERRK